MKGTGSWSDLIAAVVALGWVWGLLVMLAMGGFIPLMLFSIMRSMKGIRRELSTLNETLQNKLIMR